MIAYIQHKLTGALTRGVLATLALCVLSGCHGDMWNEVRLKPLEGSAFFENGQSSRTFVAGTVSYNSYLLDEHFNTGMIDGVHVDALPDGIELNQALLERGRERFTIYCTPCHGTDGNGQGMIVQRGFPPPPSYHIDRLREVPLGYFVDVITNGFGRMFSYATRVRPEDRWAIAAYTRALQLSQYATKYTVDESVLHEIEDNIHQQEIESASEEEQTNVEH